jgi:hypothetical protein
MQKYNLQKICLKETKILQDISNLKFQHKSKYHLSKILISKIDLLPMGQNPLSYTILYNESKHNILAYQGKANK